MTRAKVSILSLSKDALESSRHRRKSKEYNMFGVCIILSGTSFDRLRMRSVWREVERILTPAPPGCTRAKVSILSLSKDEAHSTALR